MRKRSKTIKYAFIALILALKIPNLILINSITDYQNFFLVFRKLLGVFKKKNNSIYSNLSDHDAIT